MTGAVLPVTVTIFIGLANEGFRSLGFLFYPGAETWVQAALLVAYAAISLFTIQTATKLSQEQLSSGPRSFWPWAAAGAMVATAVLIAVGLGETPWRKFYTYVVAPRAVTLWLCLALPLQLVRLLKSRSPGEPAG